MTYRSQVINSIGSDLYSIQVYDTLLVVKDFNPTKEFTKWATIEVADFSSIPEGMESFEMSGGKYAVFLHKGSPREFQKTFQHIFNEWLPSTQYRLDHRPHFELLGEKYRNNHPNSEEEVWVPVK
jgi:AraC family transcriptional regulator